MQVLVLCGSKSDLPVMKSVIDILKKFHVDFVLNVASAHRTPGRVKELVAEAESKGAKVIIAAAGLAAHLAGTVASITTLPVVGIPMNSGPLNGQDALLSTVQMPPGIPVATMAIGRAGAINSALFAVQLLALGDQSFKAALEQYRKDQAEEIIKSDPKITGTIKGDPKITGTIKSDPKITGRKN